MLNLIQRMAIRLRHDERGQTFVEYALLIGVVSLALATAFLGLSGVLGDLVDKIESELGLAGGEEPT